MKDFKLIDSSVWVSYLINGDYRDIIDNEEILLLSVLSLFEVEKRLMKEKLSINIVRNSMDFIKKRSLIIEISVEIAEKAVQISLEKNLPAIDALVYSGALINKAKLITLDNDFRNLSGVEILD